MTSSSNAIAISALIALATLPPTALAQTSARDSSWPTRYVRMVVPGGSGTAANVTARLVGGHLAERWKQQVVVENRPGAGGIIGTAHIAQSAPDGYSLLFVQGTPLSLTPYSFTSIPYNVDRDLEPIVFIGMSPLVLASNNKVPAKTVADLIDIARKHPGKLSFATSSARSIPHLAGEYFKQSEKVDLLHVPYVGYSLALQDTISGTIDLIFGGGTQIIPQGNAGKLHLLGVTSAKRLPNYPGIPAIGETLPGYSISGWLALMAPKGTPTAIVARINTDVKQILDQPNVKAQLQKLGIYPETATYATPEDLVKFIHADSSLMQRIMTTAKLKPVDRKGK